MTQYLFHKNIILQILLFLVDKMDRVMTLTTDGAEGLQSGHEDSPMIVSEVY